jgi:hypothetical protein
LSYILKRYKYFLDEFSEAVLINDAIISSGTNTVEFLESIFTKKSFEDVIYIAANPFVSSLAKEYDYRFKHIEPVWNYGFNTRIRTVPPEEVLKAWLRSVIRFGYSYRYIIHFIQPHFPALTNYIKVSSSHPGHIIELVRKGSKSRYYFKTAYIVNLVKVLSVIAKLLKIAKLLGFKTAIITSDHGDFIELGGHPYGTYVVDLFLIPYVVIDVQKVKIKEHEYNGLKKIIELHKRVAYVKQELINRRAVKRTTV